MAKIEKGARFISKYSDSSEIKPTIPTNDDHTTGWNSTDIYEGEWYFNTADSTAYFRSDNGIFKVVSVQIKDSGGHLVEDNKISPSLLPGNYMGAMLYRGTWDASLGTKPGGDDYTPENGDYFIISASGTTNPGDNIFLGDFDWKIGDFAIYTKSSVKQKPNDTVGVGWEKIDNTEQIVYAKAVVYDHKTYFPNLTNAQDVLDDIYYTKYLVPHFDNYLKINKGALIRRTDTSETVLMVSGNTYTEDIIHITGGYKDINGSKKWMTYDDNEMNIGSYDGNNIINFGTYGHSTGILSLTNTVNFRYLASSIQYTAWKLFSSASNNYIKGYNNISESVKISANETSILTFGLYVGIYNNNLPGKLIVNEENATTTVSIARGGNNPTINTNIGNIIFYQDYDSSPIEYSKFSIRTNSSAINSTFGINVKTGTNVLNSISECFTIYGTSTYNLAYIGINKSTPTVPLDVNGDTNIAGVLNVNNSNASLYHTITGKVNVYDNFTFYDKMINFNVTNSGDIISINNELYLSYDNAQLTKTLYVKDSTHNTKISYNVNNGIGLYSTNLALTDSTISGAQLNAFTVNEVSSYKNTVSTASFTNAYNIIHKEYVDYQIFAHAVGFFISGQTVEVGDKDVVLYNNTTDYYLGVNIFDPSYNLDIKGTARISNYLYVTGSGATFDGELIANDIATMNTNTFIKGNLMLGSGTAATKLHVYDSSPYLTLQNSSVKPNSGDSISNIYFGDSHSIEQASIKVIRGTTSSSNSDVPTDMLFFTTSDNNNTSSERMRIDYNGNIGIGQSYPNAKLDIYNSGNYNTMLISGSGNYTPIVISQHGHIGVGGTSNVGTYVFNVSGNTYFQGNSTYNGKIFTSDYIGIGGDLSSTHAFYVLGKSELLGNVGVGSTADSTNKLKVVGSTYFSDGINVMTGSLSIGSTDNRAPYNNALYVSGYTLLNSNVGINIDPDDVHMLHVSGYTCLDGNVSIGVIHDPNYALKVKGKIYTNDNIYANNINATSTVYCDILNNNTIDTVTITTEDLNADDVNTINIKCTDIIKSNNILATGITSNTITTTGITSINISTSNLTATGNTIYSGLISSNSFVLPFKKLEDYPQLIISGVVYLNYSVGFNWSYYSHFGSVTFVMPSESKYNGTFSSIYNSNTRAGIAITGSFIYRRESVPFINRIELAEGCMLQLRCIIVSGSLCWYVVNSGEFTINGSTMTSTIV